MQPDTSSMPESYLAKNLLPEGKAVGLTVKRFHLFNRGLMHSNEQLKFFILWM